MIILISNLASAPESLRVSASEGKTALADLRAGYQVSDLTTRACTHKSGTFMNLAMSALPPRSRSMKKPLQIRATGSPGVAQEIRQAKSPCGSPSFRTTRMFSVLRQLTSSCGLPRTMIRSAR